jgi:ketosteroid isomerase-like protein
MTIELTRREMMRAGAAATLAGGAPGCGSRNGGPMTSIQAEIGALLDRRTEAIRARSIDRLMSVFSSDIVYFDIVPPLRYSGTAALRGRFSNWFDRWKSAIVQEIGDLNVLASGDVAAAHMLVRAGGTLKNGREVGYWVRVTNSCRRSNDGWLITHEHVSLPVDFESGKAVMDLVP